MALQSLRATPDHEGTVIRRWRTRRGWSLADLGRRTGMSPGFLRRFEAHAGNITVDRLQRLAGAFGASAGELCAAVLVTDVFDRADAATRCQFMMMAARAMGPEKVTAAWQFLACVDWPSQPAVPVGRASC